MTRKYVLELKRLLKIQHKALRIYLRQTGES